MSPRKNPARPFLLRVYEWCLRLYPRSFRDRFGPEMLELAGKTVLRAGRVSWTARMLFDLAGSVPREHLRRIPRRGRGDVMHGLAGEIQKAFRALVRQPWPSALVVAMLAVGIGGNVAIFSLVNGLLLRPLPYPHPERLVYLSETAPTWNLEIVGIDYHDFHIWREESGAFESMAVFAFDEANVRFEGGDAERVKLYRATHELPDLLGARIVVGRSFAPDEDRPGAPKVALLSRSLWESRLGGDEAILGEALPIDGEPHTIVGIADLPPMGPAEVGLLLPLAENPVETGHYYLDGVGRLREGVSLEAALRDLERLHRGIAEKDPEKAPVGPYAVPFREPLVKSFRPAAWLLWGAVGIVFVVACANAASVILARASARSRELALRRALGAGRGRILRQLVSEGFLLALAGGALGVLLGLALLELFVRNLPPNVPSWARFELDSRVALFTVAISFLAPLLFSLLPALHASGAGLRAALQEGGDRSATAGRSRALGTLVVVETALALLLLISAGLLSRTFIALGRADPGFRPENALSFRVALPAVKYDSEEKDHAFFRELLDRIRAVPGVQATAAANLPPMNDHWGTFFEVEGAPPLRPDEPNPVVLLRISSPGYLRTVGIELRAGRDFDPGDEQEGAERVAIVNEEFQKQVLKQDDAVGRRIKNPGDDQPWITIVGVVRDLKHYGVDQEMRPGVYLLEAQRPVSSMSIVVRSPLPPEAIVSSAREIVRLMDPEVPLFDISTLTDRLDRSLQVRRLYAWVFGAFAVVALGLTLGGIYGTLSYVVSQRTREIGIRVALGARQREVLDLVLRRALRLVTLGAALGLFTAFATARMISSLLHGVPARDPGTYAALTALLVMVAVLASLPPAIRAARLDPVEALRVE